MIGNARALLLPRTNHFCPADTSFGSWMYSQEQLLVKWRPNNGAITTSTVRISSVWTGIFGTTNTRYSWYSSVGTGMQTTVIDWSATRRRQTGVPCNLTTSGVTRFFLDKKGPLGLLCLHGKKSSKITPTASSRDREWHFILITPPHHHTDENHLLAPLVHQ